MTRLSDRMRLTPDQRNLIYRLGEFKDKVVEVQVVNNKQLPRWVFVAAEGEDRGVLMNGAGNCLGISRRSLETMPERRCEECPGDGSGCPAYGCGQKGKPQFGSFYGKDGCTCEAKPEPIHACPYDHDVNNNPTPTCNCCENCQDLCGQEI